MCGGPQRLNRFNIKISSESFKKKSFKIEKTATSGLTFYALGGRVKISQKPKVFSCYFLQFLFHKIYFIRCPVLQGLMKSLPVIILEPGFQAVTQFRPAFKRP